MFNQADEKFAAFAADASKRREMISSRQLSRTVLFWCAVILTACDLLGGWFGGRTLGLLTTATVIQWVIVFKFDSDVRLLTVIDKLAGQGAQAARG